jgi:hypothetical protein
LSGGGRLTNGYRRESEPTRISVDTGSGRIVLEPAD